MGDKEREMPVGFGVRRVKVEVIVTYYSAGPHCISCLVSYLLTFALMIEYYVVAVGIYCIILRRIKLLHNLVLNEGVIVGKTVNQCLSRLCEWISLLHVWK